MVRAPLSLRSDFNGELCLDADGHKGGLVITNPPFRLAEEFVLRALSVAREGVAILARTVFLESVGRYEDIFRSTPPTKVGQFVERVPMVRGRLDGKASTATGYAWFVWEKGMVGGPRQLWIPPCRKELERHGDY